MLDRLALKDRVFESRVLGCCALASAEKSFGSSVSTGVPLIRGDFWKGPTKHCTFLLQEWLARFSAGRALCFQVKANRGFLEASGLTKAFRVGSL